MNFEEDNMVIRPMKPSHVDFGKSKIKERHVEVLNRFGYIENIDWVRLGGDELVLSPRED
jgi:ribosomal protein S8